MQKYFYLGGSRNKLQDFDLASDRDWDFNCRRYDLLPAVDQEWIRECFNKQDEPVVITFPGMLRFEIMQSNSEYKDTQFAGYWKHKIYPQVTLIERHDLALYMEAFEDIDLDYWKSKLWKSNPDQSSTLSRDDQVRYFNMLYNFHAN